ncbi:hypothetical protein [Yoonia sp. BS5-3]|uniref:Uncharacterized protein n=1 Tax=Yoonia phaeophyticola TaxID=3137369 RepID=A0ABZ2V473_9RHOB
MKVYRHRISAFAILFSLALPNVGATQTIEELIERLNPRTYFAPITVLGDHPKCNGPGEVAFSVEIVADDLDFEVEGETWDGSVYQYNDPREGWIDETCIIGQTNFGARPIHNAELCHSDYDGKGSNQTVIQREAPKCYITQRSGTEETQFEIPCDVSRSPSSLNALVEQADIQVDALVRADICQSLTGIALIESSWTLDLEFGGYHSTAEGILGDQEAGIAEGIVTPKIDLNYHRSGFSLRPIDSDPGLDPNFPDPLSSAYFFLTVEIEPAPIPGTSEGPVKLLADRRFNPNLN